MPSRNEPPLQTQLAELDDILAWFDQADIDLDEALQKFERGTELADAIKSKLTKLENNIEIIKQRFDQPA